MDLMEENPIKPKNKKNTKFKIALALVLVLIIILIAVAVYILIYAQSLKSQTLKVTIDGILNSNASNAEGLFLIKEGKIYTSIEDICNYVGYNFYKGEYKQYTEDRTKCYINNSKEIVTFASGSKEIVKYTADVNDLPQTFEIDEEVILQGERLYLSEQGLSKAFNLMVNYDEENNSIEISLLPYLTAYYERVISDASLEKSTFDEKIKFNNEKALLKNLVVIQDPNTMLYGVSSINNSNNLITVISPRYSIVEYMEGADDFIVTTEDKKVGIIGSDGITKVRPDYDTISVIDKNIGLYLVSNDNKQSVINNNGKIIVHQDYDSIGLEVNSYEDPEITNRFLLLENCIPVKLNDKWGLIDKDGDTILPVQYDGIGCSSVENTQAKNTYGKVLIPEVNGIVVEVDSTVEGQMKEIKKYGIIDATTGKLMVNTVLDSVYSVTTEEITRYFMTAGGQEYNIVEWVEEQRNATNNSNNNNNNDNNSNRNNNGNN